MVWRAAPDPEPARRPVNPGPGLRRAALLSAVTAAAALLAAGAESWRFVLMLQGRTLVLDGSAVRASDVLVSIGGILAPLTALVTLVYAVPVLAHTNAAAARRLGRAPSRTTGAIAARVLTPGWNVYGAGQVVTEIDRMLSAGRPVFADLVTSPTRDTAGPGGRASSGSRSRITTQELVGTEDPSSRAAKITVCWWFSWVLSAVLVTATMARGLGGSLQAIADTVELHIAVDLAAALVAVLGLLVLRRFGRLLAPPESEFATWIVQPPAPTRPLPSPPGESSTG